VLSLHPGSELIIHEKTKSNIHKIFFIIDVISIIGGKKLKLEKSVIIIGTRAIRKITYPGYETSSQTRAPVKTTQPVTKKTISQI